VVPSWIVLQLVRNITAARAKMARKINPALMCSRVIVNAFIKWLLKC